MTEKSFKPRARRVVTTEVTTYVASGYMGSPPSRACCRSVGEKYAPASTCEW